VIELTNFFVLVKYFNKSNKILIHEDFINLSDLYIYHLDLNI